MPKPTFLYIGAAKAGSTWIAEVLREHPEIYLPPVKDVQFFDHQFEKGTDWYYAHFKRAKGFKAAGELSHDYFMSAVYAQRIYNELPRVKLICCLREPVDRTNSKFVYGLSTERIRHLSEREFCFRNDIINENDYLSNLRPFYSLFPIDNICVVFYDEIREQPQEIVRRLYAFLGVAADFQPSVLNQVVLGAQQARMPCLAQNAYAMAKLFRRIGLANLVGVVKRNPVVNTVLYKQFDRRPSLVPETKTEIHARFSKDYPELERLIGRKLPAAWYQPS